MNNHLIIREWLDFKITSDELSIQIKEIKTIRDRD